MPITRINSFRAKPGKVATLRDSLVSVLPAIETSVGCHSAHVLQSESDPDRLVVVEIWDSVEAHKASLKNVQSGAIDTLVDILAEHPAGEYYKNIQG